MVIGLSCDECTVIEILFLRRDTLQTPSNSLSRHLGPLLGQMVGGVRNDLSKVSKLRIERLNLGSGELVDLLDILAKHK